MKDISFSEYKKMKNREADRERNASDRRGTEQGSYRKHSGTPASPSQPRNIPVRSLDPYEFAPYEHNNYSDARQNVYYRHDPMPDDSFYPDYDEDLAPNGPNNVPPERPVRKKKHRFFRFIVTVVLLVAILGGAVFGYAYNLCGKTNYVKSESRPVSYDVMYDDGIYNVLLVGTDKENGGASRSDTMMLLSINRNDRTLKMTSFLRDMWVEIPGHGNAKLNAAFAYGGAELMMKTIENNFKVRIDNYILVDFDMFQALIDGLGGVDVEITEKEAAFINRTSHAKVKEGVNHLDGDYALIYCRIRKLDSDFMRTQRQRKVMSAIIKQVGEQGLIKAASAATNVLPYITTDINAFSLTLKAFGAVEYIKYESDQLQIPLSGAYTDRRINGQAVLWVDFDKNREALHEFIYG